MTEENKELLEEVEEVEEEVEESEKSIQEALSDFKNSLEENFTRENLEAKFDELSKGVTELYGKAVAKYKEISQNPKTQEAIAKAKTAVDEAAETVKGTYDKTVENLSNNEKFREAVEKGKSLFTSLQDRYAEFTHNPRVRAVVRNAVDSIGETINRVVTNVKNSIDKGEEEECQCQCEGECQCDGNCECENHCECHEEENKTEE